MIDIYQLKVKNFLKKMGTVDLMDEMTEVIALLEELVRYCQAAECRCECEVIMIF